MIEEHIPRKTIERIDGILASAHLAGRHHLLEHEVYGILEVLGLNVPRHHFIRKGEEISGEDLAAFRGHDLIIKVVSKDIRSAR